MRRQKVAYNAIAGLSLQLVMIIYGFVFPRLVMEVYGSKVNGLLQSISQLLAYISLLDAGVSAVIRAKLYKPLADFDTEKIQSIVNSAKSFYKKIALTFVVYIVGVSIILPITYNEHFDYLFTASLVVIIALSTFAEYFFGISYTVLLEADQRKYISHCIQTISVIANILVSILLIKFGYSIHLVKLISSIIFIVRPVVLSVYCSRRYNFSRRNINQAIIENKWSGLGHHIAYFLHSHIDIVLLTFVHGPLIVSVYSVYNMVVTSLRSVIFYVSGGVEAAFGNMIARREEDTLARGLKLYELMVFSLTTVFYSTTAITIFQFVKVYTSEINDVDYIIPSAGIALIIAEALYCIRKPYEAVVMASGKLKETMIGGFVEAAINILISVVLVYRFGILGVAIGTVIATLFRTVQYVYFVSRNIVKRSIVIFFKNLTIYGVVGVTVPLICSRFLIECNNYFEWGVYALIIFLVSSVAVIVVNLVFYKNEFTTFMSMLMNLTKRKTGK